MWRSVTRGKYAKNSQVSSPRSLSVDFRMRQTETSETSANFHQATWHISVHNEFNLPRQIRENSNSTFTSFFVIIRRGTYSRVYDCSVDKI